MVSSRIHQPSAELFEVFDRLLLLRKGGQTVYFGDLGDRSTKLIHYFESNGGRTCGPTENPYVFLFDELFKFLLNLRCLQS